MKFWRRFIRLLRSLQWKLVYIFMSMCVILVVVVYVVINSGLRNIYYDSFKTEITNGYKNWEGIRIVNSNTPISNEELISLFKEKGDDKSYFGVREYLTMTIIDINEDNKPTRNILYSSDKQFSETPEKFVEELYANSENLISIWAQRGFKENETLIKDGDSQYFEYILQPKGREDIIFYFAYQKDAWADILSKFNSLIFTSAIFAVLLSLVLGYLLSKTITSPIVSVMHKAEKVAEGQFDQPLAVKSADEIGNLTKTFNYMAHELKKTLVEISSEKNKVETIINYMADGIMAYGLDGRTIHVNPAARKLFGQAAEEMSFAEFAQKVGLKVKVEDIVYFENSPVSESDAIIDDMYVKVYFAVFTDTNKKPEGIIVVLHDVTEQQKLEAMRREFVANVSHELRTPITSIKSYTETLLDGAAEDKETTERFLSVINSEADRMTRLVKDLLQLSRLDNQQMNWKMQNISLASLTKEIVERMQIEAAQNNQKLECFVIGDIPLITADNDRLEQVIVNLISNALKYTAPGGSITVYVGKLYNDVYIKVTDNGIGIPNDALPRVFERFYRVDKARSRDMGGTGLGLAIAKEIIQAHGGSISIASEYGKGTEVTAKLPSAV